MAAPGRQSHCGRRIASLFAVTLWFLSSAPQVGGDQSQGAVFLREFTLIRRESLNEDFLPDLLNNNHKTEDMNMKEYWKNYYNPKWDHEFR